MSKITSSQYLRFILPAVFFIPYFLFFGLLRRDIFSAILFLAGLYFGQIFYLADEKWLYDLYAEKQLIKTSSGKHLITRSTLFTLILIPLTIFVLTSSGNLIGMGLILGIHLAIIEEMWRTINTGLAVQRQSQSQANYEMTGAMFFQNRFFYDLKKSLSQSEINTILYLWVVMLMLFSLLVFI